MYLKFLREIYGDKTLVIRINLIAVVASFAASFTATTSVAVVFFKCVYGVCNAYNYHHNDYYCGKIHLFIYIIETKGVPFVLNYRLSDIPCIWNDCF